MKFYAREKELAVLEQLREIAFRNHSMMVVISGRKRVGKTALIFESCKDTPTVYLYAAKNAEAALYAGFVQEIRRVLDGVALPDNPRSFAELFKALMHLGKTQKFNLVIDEFQNFALSDPAIYADIKCIWDMHKDCSNVLLFLCGSNHQRVLNIFKETASLYGCLDSFIRLKPFTTTELKAVFKDYKPDFTPEELLALYALTGGVPRYVDYFLTARCFDIESMAELICSVDTLLFHEGILLLHDLGRECAQYVPILEAVASGCCTAAGIERRTNIRGAAAYLKRIEDNYGLVSKHLPILTRQDKRNVRYQIPDPFLRFWLRTMSAHRDVFEHRGTQILRKIILNDYQSSRRQLLVRYFTQKLSECGQFRDMGAWWLPERCKESCEIDIVGIKFDGSAVLAAVHERKEDLKPGELAAKAETFKRMTDCRTVETLCLTLYDM